MRTVMAVCALLVGCGWLHAADLKLIPQPQQVELLEGQLELTGTTYAADDRQKDDWFAARQLGEELARLPFRTEATGAPPARVITVGTIGALPPNALKGEYIAALKDKGPEAYFLRVRPGGGLVTGNSPAGTFYGAQTLKQLIRANRTGTTIPCCRIVDWPGMKYRGYSDDISRGPIPTMDFFKRQIRTMAECKMNMLTFYTEHVFKLKKYPFIAPEDGITTEQIAELSAYAKQYHVQLVGNFQSFGHFYNILKHDQFKDLRETAGILTPAKEESYQLLDDIYSEIAPAYNSPLFNVNCDETQGLGEGPSKPLAEKIGVGGVYLQHMNRIHALLRDKYHKRMMMWGDIALMHPDIVPQLAKDTVLLSWGYGAAPNYDRAIEPFVKAGLEFMVCPGVSCWSQIFPQYENAVVNIQNYVRDGAKFGAIGMLNTTWDDDGENLFTWNFYGTNWGGACAWRPADSSLAAYDDAFAPVMYGTRDDRITKAIKLLSACAHNPLTQHNMDGAFWVRPFTVLATTYDSVMKQSDALCQTTGEARALLARAKENAKLDAGDLDYLDFAAARLQFIGRARQLQFTSAKAYSDALLSYPDPKPAATALAQAREGAEEMVQTITTLRAEYERLWLLENRPWWLKQMRGKYDSLLADLTAHRDRIAKAQEELTKTGTPPDPAALGLQLVETGKREVRAVPAAEPLLPANAKWWDDRWPARLPLKVQLADNPVTDYPVSLTVNFGDQAVDPASVRVVEHRADGQTEPLLTQFEPGTGNAGRVVFILPGATAAKAARAFAVYCDVAGSPAKPPQPASDLKVTARDGWVTVENSKYRVLVGGNGAHLYEWYVKALGNLEITQPGAGDWQGFADSGQEDRNVPFDLQVESAGPVQVRIRAVARTGTNEKRLLFYAGQPYVEVMLARPVGFYWDYDNVDNFAADKAQPGTAVFSNGHKEPICRTDEQVHNVADGVYWCAKTRADGLTLANLTPVLAGRHMTGPGGGWGGVGIEGSAPTAHFVTFADKLTGDIAPALNALQKTLDLRQQPRVWLGKAERKQ